MELEREVTSLAQQANKAVVVTATDYEYACSLLGSIKDMKTQVGEVLDPIIQKAHQAHKEAVAQKKKICEPLDEAEVYLKKMVGRYLADEEERRRAEETRLLEEARISAAIEAAEGGDLETSEGIIDGTITPALAVAVQSNVPKVEGIGARQNWKYRIVDENKIPREFMTPDEKKIGAVVRAMKNLTRIPGVEVYNESTVTVRR